jgi:hypothetical protein
MLMLHAKNLISNSLVREIALSKLKMPISNWESSIPSLHAPSDHPSAYTLAGTVDALEALVDND